MRRCRYVTIALFAGALLSTPTAWADDSADPLNALMMGGTTAPTPSEFWQDTIVTDYIDPATGQNYTPVHARISRHHFGSDRSGGPAGRDGPPARWWG